MYESEKFWDRTAKNFEKIPVKIIEKVKRHIKSNDTVLDFGCATGTVVNEIAADVKEIHGIDISSRMIEIAKEKASKRMIGNAYFTQASIFDSKFKEETFDVILAFNVLHLFKDTKEVIKRINELLKNGGLFISSTVCLAEKNTFFAFLFSLLSKIRIIPYVKFFNISELEDIIVNNNFEKLESEKTFSDTYSYFIVVKKTKRTQKTN
jgi:2-polyprenyl-3-methyl-5-hydroxy-6-metoxy-1,4-benzoquinol methylase